MQHLSAKDKKNLFFLVAIFLLLGTFILSKSILQQKKIKTKAAAYDAVFLMIPSKDGSPNGINMSQGEKRKVMIYLDTALGTSGAAEVNGLDLKMVYDPVKIKIVDESGNAVTAIDTTGNIFANQNPFIAENKVDSSAGIITLSEITTTGSYSGSGLVASFYIRALTNSGSTLISFDQFTQGSFSDNMNVFQKINPPNYPDILSAALMNGAAKSTLQVNLTSPTVASMTMVSSNSSIKIGDVFNIGIDVSTNNIDVMGMDVVLQYDPTIVEFTPPITGGSIFAIYQGLDNAATQTQLATINFSGYSTTTSEPPAPYNSSSGTGRFVDLKFKALKAGTAAINFVFSGPQTSTTDCNILKYYSPNTAKNTSDDILSAVSNLSLNIAAAPTSTNTPSPRPTNTPAPTLTPTTAPTPTNTPIPPPTATRTPTPIPPTPTRTPTPIPPTPTPTSLPTPTPTIDPNYCTNFPSDVNGDHTVDSTDLSIIVAGWGDKFKTIPVIRCTVDLNRDQKVNAADIQILISWWGVTR